MNILRALWCRMTHTSSFTETETTGPNERGVTTTVVVRCECGECGRPLRRVPQ